MSSPTSSSKSSLPAPAPQSQSLSLSVSASAFECGVCLEPFTRRRAKQCTILCDNGHYACRTCCCAVSRCPICRTPVLKRPIVNRFLMELVPVRADEAEEEGEVEQEQEQEEEVYLSPYYCTYAYIGTGMVSYYFTPTDFFVNGVKCSAYSLNLLQRRVVASVRNLWGNHGDYDYEFTFSEDFSSIADGACHGVNSTEGYWNFGRYLYKRRLDAGSSLTTIGEIGKLKRINNHFFVGGNLTAIILVKITPLATEIHIQVKGYRAGIVPWGSTEQTIPYLVANDVNYSFFGAHQPTKRSFEKNEIMVLRFQPLPLTTTSFSLIEGIAGLAQMAGGARSNWVTYWNFMNVLIE